MSVVASVQRRRRRRLAFRSIGALLRTRPTPVPYIYPGPPRRPDDCHQADWRLAA